MKFSVGLQTMGAGLLQAIGENKDHIREVYFSWGDFPNGRSSQLYSETYTPRQLQQDRQEALKQLSQWGIPLNLLFNATCYGAESQSWELFNKIGETVDYIGEQFGLESVTTTSPLIAKFIKANFPEIQIRASVNMSIGTVQGMDYIANGDIAKLQKISKFEERYGLHFAEARISFPDYDDQEIVAKVILDTLDSESASLTYEQSNMLYQGVNEDYSHITTKKKRYEAVREDKYYNALQLKYANAVTCHKSQGGQWRCVFIDNPFWQEELTVDDLKWLYTAITRASEKVYFVNFKDELFAD